MSVSSQKKIELKATPVGLVEPSFPPRPILTGYVQKKELAVELGLNERTLDRWDVLGTGPPRTRVGRKVFYRRESVRKWLTGREQARANTAGVCNHGPSNRS